MFGQGSGDVNGYNYSVDNIYGTGTWAQPTASGQCTGGTLSSSWAAHANSVPAQDCYLNVMQGLPDGTRPVLSFDANACYGGGDTTIPSVPKNLRIW